MKTQVNVLFLSQTASALIPRLEREFDHTDLKVKFTTSAEPQAVDFIMVDHALLKTHFEKLKILLNYPDKLSILTSLADHIAVNNVINETRTSHLFGLSGPNALSDLRDYIIAQTKRAFWTTETIVHEPKINEKISWTTSLDLQEKLENFLGTQDFSDCFEGIENYLSQIMNELLTNALYNAPVDAAGNFKYREKNRKDIVLAEPGKEPVLEFLMDDTKICFKVMDHYGSLLPEKIFEFLTKGVVQEKKGGAGIGLYLAFKYSHKMVINICPGNKTEVMILIEKDKRFKRFSSKEKSFHMFHFNKAQEIEL